MGSVPHMKHLLYVSPSYWYTQGNLLAWFVGRKYENMENLTCTILGQEVLYPLKSDISGEMIFAGMYGTENIHQGFPLLVLFVICLILALSSFVALLFNTRHRHSKHTLEAKPITLVECRNMEETTEEDADA